MERGLSRIIRYSPSKFLIWPIKQLIIIGGPTASGKTGLSVALAKELNTVILSADSRQFYREMSIGTAKPSKEEMDDVKHYFIDSHNIQDEVTAGQFEKEATEILEKEFQDHDRIILVGGSGMFIDALCSGLDDIPASKELQDQLQHELETLGLQALQKELKIKDPSYFAQMDEQNPARVLRALEAIRITGKPYSELRKGAEKKRPFEVIRFVIDWPRQQLYERINLRVDLMMQEGLLEEVKALEKHQSLRSMNTVGYKELFAHLSGELSLEDAVAQIKQNSRRYAKRQLTWFKRHPETTRLKADSHERMLKAILKKLTS